MAELNDKENTSTPTESDPGSNGSRKGRETERWKQRINRLGDIYFDTCRRLAAGINRMSKDDKK